MVVVVVAEVEEGGVGEVVCVACVVGVVDDVGLEVDGRLEGDKVLEEEGLLGVLSTRRLEQILHGSEHRWYQPVLEGEVGREVE